LEFDTEGDEDAPDSDAREDEGDLFFLILLVRLVLLLLLLPPKILDTSLTLFLMIPLDSLVFTSLSSWKLE